MEIYFFNKYLKEIIATFICIIVFIGIRFLINSIIVRFGEKSHFSTARINLTKRYTDWFIFTLALISLIGIWGVEGKQAFVVISSIFTVIGVAMFAQWSILSNITAGIIVFFSFPFKIGDKIRIIDKETPLEAEIIDIKAFYTLMINDQGQKITFPNNQLLQKGIIIISQPE